MNCQLCGAYAPTKTVTFYQNIGALVMRFHRKLQGNLCKSCVHKNFWQMTLITLAVGWLGLISLIIAPIFVVANIVQYLRCLGMPAASATALQPAHEHAIAHSAPPPVPSVPPSIPVAAVVVETLTNESIEALNPHVDEIATRLNAGEAAAAVATSMSLATGVTPAQVALYIKALSEQAS